MIAMNWFRELGRRLVMLLRRGQFDADLEAEMRLHRELREQEQIERGLSPKEPHYVAQRHFGNDLILREESRDMWGWNWLQTLLQDVRYGFRMLAKNPGFTAVAVLTLALGIGANTAIFSLIDTAILRSLPVRDPQRLVVFKWTARNSPNTKGYYSYLPCPSRSSGTLAQRSGGSPDVSGEHGCSFSYPMFHKFQALRDAFLEVCALGSRAGINLRANGPAGTVRGELVSGEFFETLGVGTALGRTLAPSDDTPGAPPVVVLGYGYWKSAFGGDPGVLGRIIWLNNIPVTIVGIAEKDFPGLDPTRSCEMWLPLSLKPQLGKELFGSIGGDHPSLQAGDDNWWVYLVARLKPGVTIGQAEAAADALFHNDVLGESKTLFKAEDSPRLVLMTAPQAIVGLRDQFSRPLTILMVAVGVVLLIACANVAGLMLARSAVRQRELAVRLALGAGRARIARQLLTECLLLSATGGASGIVLGYWSVRSLVAFMSRGGLWPPYLAVHLDLRILALTASVSVLAGILFGLAPAFRSMHLDLTPALKESTSELASGSWHGRWWNLGRSLVVAQVALSVLVLAGAGLLVRTLQNLKSIDPGFDTQNVLLFEADPTLIGYTEAQTRSLYSELRERIQALPGVLSVSYSFDPLLGGGVWATGFRIEGKAQDLQDTTDALAVGPKFFETMRIPLLAGRTLTPQDFSLASASTWCPIVINEAFARRFLKDQNPLGLRISGFNGGGAICEIIGVVGNAKYQTLRSELGPTAYVPQEGGETTFGVRTSANPAEIIPAVRSVVSQLDNNLPLSNIRTESEQIEGSLFQERLIARLSSFFGGLSLLLACVGLYGLLSYEVTRRTREVGLRMALGAQPRDILRFIVGQGVVLSAVGSVIGILAALGLTRYLASVLYGVRPADPVTFAAVTSLLTAVALLASYLPARRATRVDPVEALRCE
jgi:predicted permease